MNTEPLTVEAAYKAIANEIIDFVGRREWDVAVGKFQILSQSTSHQWHYVKSDIEFYDGDAPKANSSAELLFLRDDLLQSTAQRIWGLTFILHPTGKFNIEYDYNKPEDYEETDELIQLDEALRESKLESRFGDTGDSK